MVITKSAFELLDLLAARQWEWSQGRGMYSGSSTVGPGTVFGKAKAKHQGRSDWDFGKPIGVGCPESARMCCLSSPGLAPHLRHLAGHHPEAIDGRAAQHAGKRQC